MIVLASILGIHHCYTPTIQMLMSVMNLLITVTLTIATVPTAMVASPAPVSLDSLEMEPSVQVRLTLLVSAHCCYAHDVY